MTNTADSPNRLSISSAHKSEACFGTPYLAVPMHHVAGLGHAEHISIHFHGGLVWELDLFSAQELARLLPIAIAKLPAIPDCSGAVADLEGI